MEEEKATILCFKAKYCDLWYAYMSSNLNEIASKILKFLKAKSANVKHCNEGLIGRGTAYFFTNNVLPNQVDLKMDSSVVISTDEV